jgi:hypothetical protein
MTDAPSCVRSRARFVHVHEALAFVNCAKRGDRLRTIESSRSTRACAIVHGRACSSTSLRAVSGSAYAGCALSAAAATKPSSVALCRALKSRMPVPVVAAMVARSVQRRARSGLAATRHAGDDAMALLAGRMAPDSERHPSENHKNAR